MSFKRVADKTGTLTEGRPKLTRIVTAEGFKEDEILMLAAALEHNSEHPLASAIMVAAKEKMALADVSNFDAPTGKGVTGTVNGRHVTIGNPRLMQELGVKGDTLSNQPAGRGHAALSSSCYRFGSNERANFRKTS